VRVNNWKFILKIYQKIIGYYVDLKGLENLQN